MCLFWQGRVFELEAPELLACKFPASLAQHRPIIQVWDQNQLQARGSYASAIGAAPLMTTYQVTGERFTNESPLSPLHAPFGWHRPPPPMSFDPGRRRQTLGSAALPRRMLEVRTRNKEGLIFPSGWDARVKRAPEVAQ